MKIWKYSVQPKHNPLCAVNRSVRGWWIAESGAFRAEKWYVLMPLLGSPAPVFLFNDDWRAGKAMVRTGDFNKETALEVGWHGNDFAMLIFYVWYPLPCPSVERGLLLCCFVSFPSMNSKGKKRGCINVIGQRERAVQYLPVNVWLRRIILRWSALQNVARCLPISLAGSLKACHCSSALCAVAVWCLH